KRFSRIFIPREITGKLGMTVFEAAHRNRNAIIYWHVDNNFIIQTNSFHQVSMQIEEGWHTLSLVDNLGESIQIKFEVLTKK
ncbi:MAG: penicillin-binding protein 1C, partial [Opitutaceae bacterium]|nr:penicillin-binding protein 1C [Cytophagales bacterium]